MQEQFLLYRNAAGAFLAMSTASALHAHSRLNNGDQKTETTDNVYFIRRREGRDAAKNVASGVAVGSCPADGFLPPPNTATVVATSARAKGATAPARATTSRRAPITPTSRTATNTTSVPADATKVATTTEMAPAWPTTEGRRKLLRALPERRARFERRNGKPRRRQHRQRRFVSGRPGNRDSRALEKAEDR